ncbi:acyl-CoA dehydrogenase family protein [Alkalimarinus coralli]|uniref:acyl-CoA dehydrogenase family protein n=1 Tax=Alkalimarinus coralli TaxID=2935863 RepID=UPI00202B11B3|nr:acyl-CoA dehydrogenase family protein [Alkalimarinus coralli]
MNKFLKINRLLENLKKINDAGDCRVEPILDWYKHTRKIANGTAFDLNALQGGFLANSVGQAFIYGYEIAIQQLTKLDTAQHLAAFCVTENKSTHPQDMQAVLSERNEGGFVLSGRKDFVTLAGSAQCLLVAAKFGISDLGRNQIKMVKVDASLSGVGITQLPALPFIPDIGHGVVAFDSVVINPEDVFSGDGYQDFVKPFRWFEDINVFVSLSAYLLKIALTYKWPVEAKVELVSILASLVSLQEAAADEPVAHIVMYDQASRLASWLAHHEQAWEKVPSKIAAGWKRDSAILKIASHPRSVRYKKAASLLGLEA